MHTPYMVNDIIIVDSDILMPCHVECRPHAAHIFTYDAFEYCSKKSPIMLNNMLMLFQICIPAKFVIFSEQIALLKFIYTLADMLLIVLLECIIW